MSSQLKGALFALLAALFFSAVNALVKIGTDWLTPWQTGMGRFAVGLLVLPLLAPVFKFRLWPKRPVIMLWRSLAGSIAFLLMIFGLKTVPLSEGLVLFYLYPVFTALIGPVLSGDKTPIGDWPFILAAFVGTAVMLWPGGEHHFTWGHGLIIGASLLGSTSIVLTRRLIDQNGPWTIYFAHSLFGTLACLGPLALQAEPALPQAAMAWWLALPMGLCAVVAQVAMNKALGHLASPRVGIIMTLEVVIAALIGVGFLGEPATWRLAVGAVMIVGSGAAINLGALPRRRFRRSRKAV